MSPEKKEPQFTEEEIGLAMAMGGPLKPIHVPIERAAEHPLLKHAVIDEHGYMQWPGMSERQKQSLKKDVWWATERGERVFALSPRVNADWFLPSDPTPDDLRMYYGRVPDLQRWYLVVDPIPHPAEATLITAFNADGERAFFARAQRAGWARIPAKLFVGLLDNPELVVVPIDRIAVDTWEHIWRERDAT